MLKDVLVHTMRNLILISVRVVIMDVKNVILEIKLIVSIA